MTLIVTTGNGFIPWALLHQVKWCTPLIFMTWYNSFNTQHVFQTSTYKLHTALTDFCPRLSLLILTLVFGPFGSNLQKQESWEASALLKTDVSTGMDAIWTSGWPILLCPNHILVWVRVVECGKIISQTTCVQKLQWHGWVEYSTLPNMVSTQTSAVSADAVTFSRCHQAPRWTAFSEL